MILIQIITYGIAYPTMLIKLNRLMNRIQFTDHDHLRTY